MLLIIIFLFSSNAEQCHRISYGDEKVYKDTVNDDFNFNNLLNTIRNKVNMVSKGEDKSAYDEKLFDVIFTDIPKHIKLLQYEKEDIGDQLFYYVSVLVVQTNNKVILKKYIDFNINIQQSASESIRNALSRVFYFYPEEVSELINERNQEEQVCLINMIVFGMLNELYPYVSKENYKEILEREFGYILTTKTEGGKVINRIYKDIKNHYEVTFK